MHSYVEEIIVGTKDESIILTEHSDVYTAGSSYKDAELINAGDIPVIYTGRGGKFTYHGPGQRVIYPLIDLNKGNRVKDIKHYVRNLEQWIINSLYLLGVTAFTINGSVGIWVSDPSGNRAKIGAIGIRVKKWVTYHGIAVNIHTDLSKYQGIIPCGINNFSVTSLEKIGVKISLNDFDIILKQEFKKIFNE